MREKYAVRYDSNGHMFVVTKPDRKMFMFKETLLDCIILKQQGIQKWNWLVP